MISARSFTFPSLDIKSVCFFVPERLLGCERSKGKHSILWIALSYTHTHADTPHSGIAEGYVEYNVIAAQFFHREVMVLRSK